MRRETGPNCLRSSLAAKLPGPAVTNVAATEVNLEDLVRGSSCDCVANQNKPTNAKRRATLVIA
jgi:hypothetical protein